MGMTLTGTLSIVIGMEVRYREVWGEALKIRSSLFVGFSGVD